MAASSSPSGTDFYHLSVLPQEVIESLALKPGGHYLDATVGGGGHSSLILEQDDSITLTAIDQDAAANP